MRVLLICAVYPPENAPAGIMTQEWAADMRDAGHEVSVLTGWPNHPAGKLFSGYKRLLRRHEIVDGINILRVWHFLPGNKAAPRRIAYWLSFSLFSFLAVLFGPKYDVIYSNTVPLTGPLAICLASHLRLTRFVYGIFDIYPEAALEAKAIRVGLVFWLALKMDKWVCQKATRIRVIGKLQQETLQRRGIPENKISLIPLWLDGSRFPAQAPNSRWREENGIAMDKIVVLYAGTIGLISGAGIVLEAASRMQDQARLLFLFVGEGALKKELQARTDKQKLNNVRFLPFQPEKQLNEVFRSANIGLVTLLRGTGKNSVPSKVLGYLAAGLPVVASVDEDSDVALYLREGQCGRVCPPQEAQPLEAAVMKFLDPVARTEAGTAARDLFERQFSRASGTARCTQFLTESLLR